MKEIKAKLVFRPDGEYPVYEVIIKDKSYYLQRMEGMNSGSAWYEVIKSKKNKNQFDLPPAKKGVWGGGDSFLGFTKADAIIELWSLYGK